MPNEGWVVQTGDGLPVSGWNRDGPNRRFDLRMQLVRQPPQQLAQGR